MTILEKRKVSNYTTLVMGKAMTIDEVPVDLKSWVEIEIAKREIAILETI